MGINLAGTQNQMHKEMRKHMHKVDTATGPLMRMRNGFSKLERRQLWEGGM